MMIAMNRLITTNVPMTTKVTKYTHAIGLTFIAVAMTTVHPSSVRMLNSVSTEIPRVRQFSGSCSLNRW